jgi:hypothetical protein
LVFRNFPCRYGKNFANTRPDNNFCELWKIRMMINSHIRKWHYDGYWWRAPQPIQRALLAGLDAAAVLVARGELELRVRIVLRGGGCAEW